jgi:hypothetical protein
MENTELIVMLNNNGQIVMTDYYSTAFQQPTQQTGTPLTLVSSSVTKSGIFGTFTRALQPSSSLDQSLSIGLVTDFSYAYLTAGGLGFVMHDTTGVGLITFGATNSTSSFIPNGSNLPNMSLDGSFFLSWAFNESEIEFTFSVILT